MWRHDFLDIFSTYFPNIQNKISNALHMIVSPGRWRASPRAREWTEESHVQQGISVGYAVAGAQPERASINFRQASTFELTFGCRFLKIQGMKMRTVLILAALVFSIVLPLKIHVPLSDDNGHVLALDVCSAGGSNVSLNAHMPVIHQCTCKLCLLDFDGFYRISNPPFTPFCLPLQKDRPPRV
jgi:hypothetical protein